MNTKNCMASTTNYINHTHRRRNNEFIQCGLNNNASFVYNVNVDIHAGTKRTPEKVVLDDDDESGEEYNAHKHSKKKSWCYIYRS